MIKMSTTSQYKKQYHPNDPDQNPNKIGISKILIANPNMSVEEAIKLYGSTNPKDMIYKESLNVINPVIDDPLGKTGRAWTDMSYNEQITYLQDHKNSKRVITASPSSSDVKQLDMSSSHTSSQLRAVLLTLIKYKRSSKSDNPDLDNKISHIKTLIDEKADNQKESNKKPQLIRNKKKIQIIADKIEINTSSPDKSMDLTIEKENQLLENDEKMYQYFDDEVNWLFDRFNIPHFMTPRLELVEVNKDISDTATANAFTRQVWISKNSMKFFMDKFKDPMVQKSLRHELCHIVREYYRSPKLFDLENLIKEGKAKSKDRERHFDLYEKHLQELRDDKTFGHDKVWAEIMESAGVENTFEEYSHIINQSSEGQDKGTKDNPLKKNVRGKNGRFIKK